MKPNFFERNGWIIYPNTFIGLFFSWIVAAYDGYLFLDIDSRSHSVSDTLINFVPNTVLILLVWCAVAFILSSKKEKI